MIFLHLLLQSYHVLLKTTSTWYESCEKVLNGSFDFLSDFRFDPAIHLNLEMPDYVRVFPDFKKMKKTPEFFGDAKGSSFTYSSPFQVFSEEGMRVLKKIIKREESLGVPPSSSRGNKIALRGLYYMSPFVRDVQTCKELREHFKAIAGEELVPHPSFMNSPQVSLICSRFLRQGDDDQMF